jgi:hypothetical protein
MPQFPGQGARRLTPRQALVWIAKEPQGRRRIGKIVRPGPVGRRGLVDAMLPRNFVYRPVGAHPARPRVRPPEPVASLAPFLETSSAKRRHANVWAMGMRPRNLSSFRMPRVLFYLKATTILGVSIGQGETDRKYKATFFSPLASPASSRPPPAAAAAARSAGGSPSTRRRPAKAALARRGAAMRDLDMEVKMGYGSVAGVSPRQSLGTAGLKTMRGDDCKRNCQAKRGE